MSKKSLGPGCDPKEASTLAASSLVHFFKQRDWKIVSFFPNSPCARKADTIAKCPKQKPSKKST